MGITNKLINNFDIVIKKIKVGCGRFDIKSQKRIDRLATTTI